MGTLSTLGDCTADESDIVRVCHPEDLPRLQGHLELITAGTLYVISGAEALPGIPCECGAIPVMTPGGLRGIEPAEWLKYRALVAAVPFGSEVDA